VFKLVVVLQPAPWVMLGITTEIKQVRVRNHLKPIRNMFILILLKGCTMQMMYF